MRCILLGVIFLIPSSILAQINLRSDFSLGTNTALASGDKAGLSSTEKILDIKIHRELPPIDVGVGGFFANEKPRGIVSSEFSLEAGYHIGLELILARIKRDFLPELIWQHGIVSEYQWLSPQGLTKTTGYPRYDRLALAWVYPILPWSHAFFKIDMRRIAIKSPKDTKDTLYSSYGAAIGVSLSLPID